MSFFRTYTNVSSNINGNLNLRTDYTQIGEEFRDVYYNLYDTNFFALDQMYDPKACITFMDDEFAGFTPFLNSVRGPRGIFKFDHSEVKTSTQPIGDSILLVTFTGLVNINNINFKRRYTETLILHKINATQMTIINSVFRMME